MQVAERIGLYHVSQHRSGAVRFYEGQLPGLHLCEVKRTAHQSHLRSPVRSGDPVAAPVVVGDRALHDGVDGLFVGQRIVESAQHHGRDALTATDAVSITSERFTATVRRGKPGLSIEDRKSRGQNEIHARGNHGVGFPGAKRGATLMQRGQ